MPQKALTALAALVLTICLIGVSPSLADSVSHFEAVHKGTRGSLTFAAGPLKSMQPVPFKLTVHDAHGDLLTGLSLNCNLTMPAMAMPPNRPQVSEQSGVYSGIAIFTMAGTWQATFTGKNPEGNNFELAFEIPEVFMK